MKRFLLGIVLLMALVPATASAHQGYGPPYGRWSYCRDSVTYTTYNGLYAKVVPVDTNSSQYRTWNTRYHVHISDVYVAMGGGTWARVEVAVEVCGYIYVA